MRKAAYQIRDGPARHREGSSRLDESSDLAAGRGPPAGEAGSLDAQLGSLDRPRAVPAVCRRLSSVRLARLVGLRHRRAGRHGLPHLQPAVHGPQHARPDLGRGRVPGAQRRQLSAAVEDQIRIPRARWPGRVHDVLVRRRQPAAARAVQGRDAHRRRRTTARRFRRRARAACSSSATRPRCTPPATTPRRASRSSAT